MPEFFANYAGKFAAEVLRDNVHLRLKLHGSDAWFEAREHGDV